MPYCLAESSKYLRIEGPSAMDSGLAHGRHGNPKVWRSESDLHHQVSYGTTWFVRRCQGYVPETWVAEEIPRPPNGTARLNDRISIVGQFGLDAICGINTGDAGTDNEHVEVRAGVHGTRGTGAPR